MEAAVWQFLVSLFGGALAGLIMSYIRIRMYEKEREKTERQLFVHRLQFETEFKIYKELWSSLEELLVATKSLRPMFEWGTSETDEEMKKRKLTDVTDAFNKFVSIVHDNRPFYAPEIYKHACELSGKAHEEWVKFRIVNPMKEGYYEEGLENIKFIAEKAEQICKAIRWRIWRKNM